MKKKTIEEFKVEQNEIHKHYYSYDDSVYVNMRTKLKIVCPVHGEFYQTPHSHITHECGCDKCGGSAKKNHIEFVVDAEKIHGKGMFDYSLSVYEKQLKKIKIKCNTCGLIFDMKPNVHLNGCGCRKCANIKTGVRCRGTTAKFIEDAKKVHGDLYDYSECVYVMNKTRMKIKCNKCGNFFSQHQNDHIQGKRGCSHCYKSKSELTIKQILSDNNIKFIEQKTFTGCRYKKPLRFDFYLPDFNVCIEYDGEFHDIRLYDLFMKRKNKPSSLNSDHFNLTKIRDEIKNKYCVDNNIKLVRINFKDKKRLNEIIESLIKELKNPS